MKFNKFSWKEANKFLIGNAKENFPISYINVFDKKTKKEKDTFAMLKDIYFIFEKYFSDLKKSKVLKIYFFAGTYDICKNDNYFLDREVFYNLDKYLNRDLRDFEYERINSAIIVFEDKNVDSLCVKFSLIKSGNEEISPLYSLSIYKLKRYVPLETKYEFFKDTPFVKYFLDITSSLVKKLNLPFDEFNSTMKLAQYKNYTKGVFTVIPIKINFHRKNYILKYYIDNDLINKSFDNYIFDIGLSKRFYKELNFCKTNIFNHIKRIVRSTLKTPADSIILEDLSSITFDNSYIFMEKEFTQRKFYEGCNGNITFRELEDLSDIKEMINEGKK